MPFLIALPFAAVLTPVAGRLGRALGLLDRPGRTTLTVHGGEVPLTGGLAVLATTALALAATGAMPAGGVIIAVAVALVAGTVDDRRPVAPAVRLLALVSGGLVLAALTPAVRTSGLPGAVGAAVLVVVGANAVNIVDGQDGLAAGMGAVSAISLGVLADNAGAEGASALGLALGGGLAGFLLWNRPPARIFLGNGGAYAVGTLLALMAWVVVAAGGVRGLVAAGACLGPFAFEAMFTVGRRLRTPARLAEGDREHSYDLVARTAGRTASTIVFVVLALSSAGVGVLVWFVPILGIPVAAVAAAVAAVWAVLLWNRRSVPT
jgi:UDP-N-acetylmuramyl pentapeptide phosphotransferase/UDP-N-acetylglucosamine-1-phosphate transferase